MSKSYAFELYFDSALEEQVKRVWTIFSDHNISSHLLDIKSRPHITLLTGSSADPQKLYRAIETNFYKQKTFTVSLSSLSLLFPNKTTNAIFLLPTPSLSLLELHSQLCYSMMPEPIEIPNDCLQGSWVPCCPVAPDVPKDRLVDTFSLVHQLNLPLTGEVIEIGLVQFDNERVYEQFKFAFCQRGTPHHQI